MEGFKGKAGGKGPFSEQTHQPPPPSVTSAGRHLGPCSAGHRCEQSGWPAWQGAQVPLASEELTHCLRLRGFSSVCRFDVTSAEHPSRPGVKDVCLASSGSAERLCGAGGQQQPGARPRRARAYVSPPLAPKQPSRQGAESLLFHTRKRRPQEAFAPEVRT